MAIASFTSFYAFTYFSSQLTKTNPKRLCGRAGGRAGVAVVVVVWKDVMSEIARALEDTALRLLLRRTS